MPTRLDNQQVQTAGGCSHNLGTGRCLEKLLPDNRQLASGNCRGMGH